MQPFNTGGEENTASYSHQGLPIWRSAASEPVEEVA
jgi:hypothetical protein